MGEQEALRQIWPYLAARIERLEAHISKQDKTIRRIELELHKLKTRNDE